MSRTNFSLPGTIDTPSDTTWDDLVLPDQAIQTLREYVLWVTHRDQVEHKWGAKVTSGPIALFSGPSGTGKTMAAKVVANVLGLDLYAVDPGVLMTKYIGETEKHLDALFAAVARQPVVLFFDEADILFGKRSEVKDAHDRYANLEMNYLLSRLERYTGPSILTSNLKEHVGPGLMRRFQFAIDFPLPDAAARSRLWRHYVPDRAPLDNDVDTDQLAKEFELTGRQIRNAALHAAFLAAGDSSAITKKHFTKAIKAELTKSGSS